jgi:uncharacterized protein YndB with AHSA1/START domain
MNDFTTTFTVPQSPEQVFAAINDVRAWWGPNVEGATDKLGDEFTYRYRDIHYSKIRIVEFIPNEKVVWLILENHLNFVDDQSEWVGTRVSFEIARVGDQTEVRFAHLGLDSEFECFESCSSAWGSLMHNSLPSLITTGTGTPYN